MKKIDMSDQAITRRLRQADQLRELSLSLMKVKRLSDANKADANKAAGGEAPTEQNSIREEQAKN